MQFHFIGSQAENFAEYWKPLMDKKPHNCQIWGERDDVDTFLQAADLFLFPSKGDRGNKELQPLVIKEAQQYLFLPKMMFNLDVYLNKYNDLTNFNFLTGDLIQDAEKIIQISGAEDMGERKDKEIIIRVVPNPYYAFSAYEETQIDNRVRITNLPESCTISIFATNGTLVRHLTKDNNLSYMDWDIKNHTVS